MEQVRLLAAVGLSFAVLFVWSIFFSHDTDLNENKVVSLVENPVISDSLSINEFQTEKVIAPAALESTHFPKEITVDTPLFRMILSERGGLIKSTVLKNYKEKAEPDSNLKEIVSGELSYGNVLTCLSSDNPQEIQKALFVSSSETDYLEVVNDTKIISFTWNDGTGKILVKSFEFTPDSYLVNMEITVQNISDQIVTESLVLSLKDEKPASKGYGFEGPSAFIDGQLNQFKIKNITNADTYGGHIDWIAIENRYFMSSIIPSKEFSGRVELSIKDNLVENRIISTPFELYPNSRITFASSLFMGPKSITLLSNVGHSMEKAIYFGIFDFIAKPCLWFMNKIYSILPNYGVSIILLTLFTKLLLWPLGSKGYKSMSEMKKLQPLMAEIRKTHKDNKQKMNKEIMALYKTYKINPMGGCLPMLLQIPVFFALYRMLYQAIELRHAPFIFWITDLSAPDRLLDFGFSIPFMQPPYGIPVLTIIMGGTMLLQQKMSPPPGDPTQAKMMMLMPIMFTFIFINFSSGLVLYWLTNNILSISQQYYIQKKTT